MIAPGIYQDFGRRFVPKQRIVSVSITAAAASYRTCVAGRLRQLADDIAAASMRAAAPAYSIFHTELDAKAMLRLDLCVPVHPTIFGRGLPANVSEATCVRYLRIGLGASLDDLVRGYDWLRTQIFENDEIITGWPRETYPDGAYGSVELQYPVD